jgi:hypothetical protein
MTITHTTKIDTGSGSLEDVYEAFYNAMEEGKIPRDAHIAELYAGDEMVIDVFLHMSHYGAYMIAKWATEE